MWHKWDANVYIEIATKGYNVSTPTYSENGDYTNHGWYPLYPLLVKTITYFIPTTNQEIATFYVGIIIPNIAYAIAILFLDLIAKQFFNFNHIKRRFLILLMLSFPGSYFYSMMYTESLYLMLTSIGTYYLLKRDNIPSMMAFSLALVTRPTAIAFVLPSLVFIFIESKQINLKLIKEYLLYGLILATPLLIFYNYLRLITGDFFAVNHWHELLNHNPAPFRFFTRYFNEFGITFKWDISINYIIMIILVIWMVFLLIKNRAEILEHKDGFKYGFLLSQSIIYWLILASGGSYTSIIRYVSVNFPFYLLLIMHIPIDSKFAKYTLYTVFAIFSFIQLYLLDGFIKVSPYYSF